MAERSWLILDEGRASALAALCETIVPGSARVEPAVYIDAKLAMLDEGTRAMALGAIDALADVADGGPEALAERTATPEFMMLRALALRPFTATSSRPARRVPAPGRRSTSASRWPSRIQHDWSFMGVPG